MADLVFVIVHWQLQYFIDTNKQGFHEVENMKLYAARDKNTGKLVIGITNPSHKFWQRKDDCEQAISRYNND